MTPRYGLIRRNNISINPEEDAIPLVKHGGGSVKVTEIGLFFFEGRRNHTFLLKMKRNFSF